MNFNEERLQKEARYMASTRVDRTTPHGTNYHLRNADECQRNQTISEAYGF